MNTYFETYSFTSIFMIFFIYQFFIFEYIWVDIFYKKLIQKKYFISFLFSCCIHISQNYNLVCCTIELPASKNQYMRTYRCRWMSISAQWWLALEFSFFPYELVVCIQYNKVINISWRNKILLASCSRIDTPSTEKDDVRSTYIGSVTISWKRRSTWYSHTCPFVFLCV